LRTIYIEEKEDISKRKMRKIIKKVYKISKKEDIVLAISKNLENNSQLIDAINEYGFKILNGRWLFKFLLYDILEYLAKKKDKPIEMLSVALLMNNMDEIIMQQLPEIANRVRTLKIVTEDINKYMYIEEKLYEEYGIALQITNNKAKSLSHIDIVLNFDFNEEELNKCNINKDGIIANIKRRIKLKSDNFEGQNINDYEISFKEENFENDLNKEEFDKNILYESYIYRKDNFSNIKKQLEKDEVKLILLK